MNISSPDHQPILHEQRGPVGVITLNRPHQHNALSPQLLKDLSERLSIWAGNDAIRVVVITGAGDKAFSAGYDINSIASVNPDHPESSDTGSPLSNKPKDASSGRTPFERGLIAVKNFPYPTIAMINGHCFGGALHLAINCDLRFASDHVAIGMPPAKLGLVYEPEGLLQFMQVLGSSKARELFFSGKTYRGAEINALGLVSKLVPADQLSDTVFSLAGEIARNAPLALKGMKQVFNRIEEANFPEALKKEARRLVKESFNSQDIKEGQTAFLEKRPPVFIGK